MSTPHRTSETSCYGGHTTSKLHPEAKEFRPGSENRRAERHGGGRLRGKAAEFRLKREAHYLSGLKGAWEDDNF